MEVVAREGRLNVIKEGGVAHSLASLRTLIPDTENIGRVSFLGPGGYCTCERERERETERERIGGGRRGLAKDFVVSRTFYSVSSGWRLLSASQRTNSSSLPIPTSNPPPPNLPPTFFAPSSLSPSSFLSRRSAATPSAHPLGLPPPSARSHS